MSDELPLSMAVITVDDHLYRRLPRETIRDGKVNRGAYYFRGEPDPSVSVDLARLTTPEAVRLRAAQPDRFGVGELAARVPLGLGLTVRPDPRTDNPAHCLLEGVVTKATCQTLAEHTTIILPPSRG